MNSLLMFLVLSLPQPTNSYDLLGPTDVLYSNQLLEPVTVSPTVYDLLMEEVKPATSQTQVTYPAHMEDYYVTYNGPIARVASAPVRFMANRQPIRKAGGAVRGFLANRQPVRNAGRFIFRGRVASRLSSRFGGRFGDCN